MIGPCLFQGYDHSYYFMATFMEDHLRHHAKFLKWEGFCLSMDWEGFRLSMDWEGFRLSMDLEGFRLSRVVWLNWFRWFNTDKTSTRGNSMNCHYYQCVMKDTMHCPQLFLPSLIATVVQNKFCSFFLNEF